ncbi:MAG TPA: class I SAM-dependent methyltransferase [Candidatus Solibacter sp.]|nr:class I SAM-dependent methyltransferase [Candidatus Solibacter sp.]
MSAPRVFDLEHYEKLNTARSTVVGDLLGEVASQVKLQTAIDVGSGLGYFSAYLHSLGLQVTAVDGRRENVEEAGHRVPQVKFHTINAEDHALRELGQFDLVFCFGLLYHLENPFVAARHLHALTRNLLLVESVIFPGSEPIMALVDETSNEDQGLNHLAFYPTEACLVKLLYRVGFPNVYLFSRMPEHEHYRSRHNARQARTMLAASQSPLLASLLQVAPEPSTEIQPWDPRSGVEKEALLHKLRRFVRRSL